MFESCDGGGGHAYTEPTIRFSGGRDGGFRALAVTLAHRFPLHSIRRHWAVIDGEPSWPDREIAFWPGASWLFSRTLCKGAVLIPPLDPSPGCAGMG
jgi:hypothetical protein